jgi:hypothetical protein
VFGSRDKRVVPPTVLWLETDPVPEEYADSVRIRFFELVFKGTV